jgi:hypothetical protein
MFRRRKRRYGRVSLLAAVALPVAERIIWRRERAYERRPQARASREPPLRLRGIARTLALRRLGWYTPETLALRLSLRAVRRLTGNGHRPSWDT